jgi:hypothetical protein
MRSRNTANDAARRTSWFASAVLLTAAWCAGARAEPPAPATPAPSPDILQAGCAACGTAGGTIDGAMPTGACCGSGCYPGRDMCKCCCDFGDSCCGHFLSELYNCICCPDPCYEPHWTALADSAFFVDAARPITQTRIRYDHAWSFENPDRAEFLMAREHTVNPQIGPAGMTGTGKGLGVILRKVDYDQGSLYTEAATGRVGAFVELGFLSIDPTVSPIDFILRPADVGVSQHHAGFGDMTIGTKTLLLDCELIQYGFEFKTFVNSGNFLQGLGTAHVSLEPSLLMSLRLTPDIYLQHQMSIWIPLGGDALYEGNIYHNHVSLNFLLCRPCPGVQVIATAECNQWLFIGGDYTDPNFLVVGSDGKLAPLAVSSRCANMVSAGPGLRLVICDKIDFGVGSAFAIGATHLADQMIRAEFRMRF